MRAWKSPNIRFPCLFVPLSTSFSALLPLSVFLSLSSLRCQPCHLPIAPLPSRVRSRVLTLGFIQICSLRGWKVVMRAKKNSLALSLTTRLVFLMKPNENCIFSPCYSLPPILHLSIPLVSLFLYLWCLQCADHFLRIIPMCACLRLFCIDTQYTDNT